MLTDDLINQAVTFHGHFGPFLILGLRAGLIGVNYLEKNYFELQAIVTTSPNPPVHVSLDGIQFVSGCTTGKKQPKNQNQRKRFSQVYQN